MLKADLSKSVNRLIANCQKSHLIATSSSPPGVVGTNSAAYHQHAGVRT
jgi:hypothetical protein